MANQNRPENFFESSAWVLFLVLGVIEILFGLGDMVAGIENDPAILISTTGRTPAELKAQDPVMYDALDHQQKVIGQTLWMTGALISIISLTAFRRGARWAWFTFWLIPVSMAFIVISSYNSRQPGQSRSIRGFSLQCSRSCGSLFPIENIFQTEKTNKESK